MDWLTGGWDREHVIALCVGLAAGTALVLQGFGGLAEFGAVIASVGLRWAIWQVPPPGRSRAVGTPPGGLSRLGQLAVAVLLITLAVEIVVSFFR